jgi:hypothetical protein
LQLWRGRPYKEGEKLTGRESVLSWPQRKSAVVQFDG